MIKTGLKILCIICFWSGSVNAQDYYYDKAYETLNAMLIDSTQYGFKKAVFAVENAYLQGALDKVFIDNEINKLKLILEKLIEGRDLKDYTYSDNETVEKYAALYTVMMDTIPLRIGNDEEYIYVPYKYDFDDIWGKEEWSNMFVSKLLLSGKGNCHSLPYLYKILAEEIGVNAHLSLAPNHIYIKHHNQKDGWYNTELTSGIFPIDAWIMASGYVHLDGIRNGIYMKALNEKESLALLLLDLAQGFDKSFPDNDGRFIFQCVETALLYYPNFVNALLLKLETTKKKLEHIAEERKKPINEILDSLKAKEIWLDLNLQVKNIHNLGYRQMPKEMYLDWLVSLKEEKEKYTNKKNTTFKTQKQ